MKYVLSPAEYARWKSFCCDQIWPVASFLIAIGVIAVIGGMYAMRKAGPEEIGIGAIIGTVAGFILWLICWRVKRRADFQDFTSLIR